MKNLQKIMMWILVLFVWFVSFSFAIDECEMCSCKYDDTCFFTCKSRCENMPNYDSEMLRQKIDLQIQKCNNKFNWDLTEINADNVDNIVQLSDWTCALKTQSYTASWVTLYCPWIVQDNVCVENYYWNRWLDINTECLTNWQCHMNIYKTLWIRKSDPNPEVKTFTQDIILAATEFFGTLITIVLIVSWLFYIISAMSGKNELASKAKTSMIWSIVWLLFVTLSYSIIRLIQFLITWWS